MNKLLIASNNPSKLKYFQRLFEGLGLKLLTPRELGLKDEPEENGKDEVENALIKARHFARVSGEVSFSDDAGLYVDALGGEPGVQVRRWMGHFPDNVSDDVWLEFFIKKMEGVPPEKRSGRFKIARAIVTPGGDEYIFKWQREIKILEKPYTKNYSKGWPMSSMCLETRFNKPWITLNWEERLSYEKESLVETKIVINRIFKQDLGA